MFVPGQGAAGQVHDFNPGILPNGVFWTMEIPRDSFDVGRGGASARLHLDNLPIPDTFFFSNNVSVSAQIDVDVMWRATSASVPRGEGSGSPAPFFTKHLAEFSTSSALGHASGRETGFSFETGALTADGFYGSIGTQRNGVYL